MTTRGLVVIGSFSVVLAAGVLLVVVPPGTAQDAEQAVTPSIGAVQAPVDVDTARLPGPKQPIFYRHDIHAGQYQMDCRYCHFAAEVSSSPGMPTVSTCMGCHLVVGRGNPEVEKLNQAWTERRPIEWVEIHKLAPFVHFPHMRHVQAEITCQTCHGPIETMPQVYQYSSLKMGWCLDCHDKNDVTTDCTACHY